MCRPQEIGAFMEQALIFNIQKCSIHDGPGIRTLVFLKGCPLRCLWCANPESQNPYPELVSNEKKCIGCKACIHICPKKCIVDASYFDRTVCDSCGVCLEVCHAEAKKIYGKNMSVDELVNIIRKDRVYYINSGGGVTFSGGEPLQSPKFLLECVKKCKDFGILSVVETCGYANYDAFAPVLEHLQLVYFDLKHADPHIHKKLTGVSNEKILKNLIKINEHSVDMQIKIPIIPGHNDDLNNLRALANIVADLSNVKRVELVAYHKLGIYKYKTLGMKYMLNDVESPSAEVMLTHVDELNKILTKAGKKCHFEQ